MIEPMYFKLDGLVSGFTASDLGSLYTEGQCYELAVGFNERYGWPVYILSDCSGRDYAKTDGVSCHAISQMAPGAFADIYGIRTLDAFEEEWSLGYCFKLRAQTPKGLARHFEEVWSVTTETHPGSTTAKVLDALAPQIHQLIGVRP